MKETVYCRFMWKAYMWFFFISYFLGLLLASPVMYCIAIYFACIFFCFNNAEYKILKEIENGK